ncbi:MAG: XRE family transcriptional regulator [Ruminococcus sp.]|nr:XRE family transcriptional regulator [Ruminococcus sp.]
MDERIKRLRQAIEQSGLTYAELGKKTGIAKSSLQRYATGATKKIPIDNIEAIAKATNVSAKYLMCWDDACVETHNFLKSITDPAHASKQVLDNDKIIDRMIADSRAFDPKNMIAVPVVGNVAAGYTCLAEMDIESYELVDSETILSGYDYMWLRVKGDSMEPLILEGDLVLVRLQDTVESGEYAVVIVDSEDGLVKEIKLDNDSITLISKNPYYPPRVFKGEDTNRIRIVGKVVESKRKFS